MSVSLTFRIQPPDDRRVGFIGTLPVIIARERMDEVKDGETWEVEMDRKATFAIAYPIRRIVTVTPAQETKKPQVKPPMNTPQQTTQLAADLIAKCLAKGTIGGTYCPVGVAKRAFGPEAQGIFDDSLQLLEDSGFLGWHKGKSCFSLNPMRIKPAYDFAVANASPKRKTVLIERGPGLFGGDEEIESSWEEPDDTFAKVSDLAKLEQAVVKALSGYAKTEDVGEFINRNQLKAALDGVKANVESLRLTEEKHIQQPQVAPKEVAALAEKVNALENKLTGMRELADRAKAIGDLQTRMSDLGDIKAMRQEVRELIDKHTKAFKHDDAQMVVKMDELKDFVSEQLLLMEKARSEVNAMLAENIKMEEGRDGRILGQVLRTLGAVLSKSEVNPLEPDTPRGRVTSRKGSR